MTLEVGRILELYFAAGGTYFAQEKTRRHVHHKRTISSIFCLVRSCELNQVKNLKFEERTGKDPAGSGTASVRLQIQNTAQKRGASIRSFLLCCDKSRSLERYFPRTVSDQNTSLWKHG